MCKDSSLLLCSQSPVQRSSAARAVYRDGHFSADLVGQRENKIGNLTPFFRVNPPHSAPGPVIHVGSVVEIIDQIGFLARLCPLSLILGLF